MGIEISVERLGQVVFINHLDAFRSHVEYVRQCTGSGHCSQLRYVHVPFGAVNRKLFQIDLNVGVYLFGVFFHEFFVGLQAVAIASHRHDIQNDFIA